MQRVMLIYLDTNNLIPHLASGQLPDTIISVCEKKQKKKQHNFPLVSVEKFIRENYLESKLLSRWKI